MCHRTLAYTKPYTTATIMPGQAQRMRQLAAVGILSQCPMGRVYEVLVCSKLWTLRKWKFGIR